MPGSALTGFGFFAAAAAASGFFLASAGTGGGGSSTGGSGSLGFSGIGHMCMVTVQSGSTTVSQTCGRIMSPFGPTRS